MAPRRRIDHASFFGETFLQCELYPGESAGVAADARLNLDGDLVQALAKIEDLLDGLQGSERDRAVINQRRAFIG